MADRGDAQRLAAAQGSRKQATGQRLRSLGWFLLAGVYAVFAQQFATRAAGVLAPGAFTSLVSRLLFLALLLAGFAGMARVGQRQGGASVVGLPLRPGFGREWALGAALGWAGIVVCVLPVALTGGLLVTTGPRTVAAVGALVANLGTLLVASLVDELLFRGYPFQRLIAATGPAFAAVLLSVLFMLGRGGFAASPAGTLATLLLGLLLATAYLRTRAVWLGWGLHFAWNASMAILFGLPVSGLTEFSPVVSTYSSGPAWLTGGGYGPEGSALAVLVLLLLFPVLARTTRDLRHQWALPEITGAGIPVDLDRFAQQQHSQGMGPVAEGPESAAPRLVQIAPAPPPPPAPPPEG